MIARVHEIYPLGPYALLVLFLASSLLIGQRVFRGGLDFGPTDYYYICAVALRNSRHVRLSIGFTATS